MRTRPQQETAPTRRADMLLVERRLFDSRAKAQAAIAAGGVTADGVVVAKPSAAISRSARLEATPAHPYVSRGGVKLAAALTQTRINAAGRVCLDVGASTGGFSEVLLAAGARRIYAVDVGTAQLHAVLRNDPRIAAMENTDIRQVTAARLDPAPDLAVIDVSFISLGHVIPGVLALLARPADIIALIKPQFEVTRAQLKKGVVRDPAVHERVCTEVAAFIASSGCKVVAQFPSPIAGGDGNREFFVVARCE
jgi:23S rRNA (cytidine1920-2'-O)/16S rRNA (cytidine1409-2'-O)-methyltransferase